MKKSKNTENACAVQANEDSNSNITTKPREIISNRKYTRTRLKRRTINETEEFNKNQNCQNIDITSSKDDDNTSAEPISIQNQDDNIVRIVTETKEKNNKSNILNNVSQRSDNEAAIPSHYKKNSISSNSSQVKVNSKERTRRVTKNTKKANILRYDEDTKATTSSENEQCINHNVVSQSRKPEDKYYMAVSLDKHEVGPDTSVVSKKDFSEEKHSKTIFLDKIVLEHQVPKCNSQVKRNTVLKIRKQKGIINKAQTLDNNMIKLQISTASNKDLDDKEYIERNEIALGKTELEYEEKRPASQTKNHNKTENSRDKLISKKRTRKILTEAQKEIETSTILQTDCTVQNNSLEEKLIIDDITSDSDTIITESLSNDRHLVYNSYIENEKVSKEALNENLEVPEEYCKEIQNEKKLSGQVHTTNLLALLKQYDFKNFNETFDFTEDEPKMEQVNTIKSEIQSILHGLLYYESNVLKNADQKSSPILKKQIPNRPSVNKNINNWYEVTLLPTVTRNGKNCLRSHIKTDASEKMYYTKGPDINEKSANLPEILLRLAERKRKDSENKLLRRKITPKNIFQLKWKFRILNHILILKLLIEKCRMYKQSLFLAFVDFKLNEGDECENNIEELDKLFKISWPYEGISIKDKAINHSRIDNHVVFIGDTEANMKTVLEHIFLRSDAAKFNIDLDKLEILSTENLDYLEVLNIKIPLVPQREHLGHIFSFVCMQEKEIERRIELGIKRFESIKSKFKHLPLCDQKKSFQDNILPILTEKAETWCITGQLISKFRKVQLNMERQMLNIDSRKKISDREVRMQSGLKDVGQTICSLKLKFVSQFMSGKDQEPFEDLFRILTWSPGVQRVGRPPRQWGDDVEKVAGISWKRFDSKVWSVLEDSYINKWAPSIT